MRLPSTPPPGRAAAPPPRARPLAVRPLPTALARDPLAFHLAIRGPYGALLESSQRTGGARFSYSLPEPFARLSWDPRHGVRLATRSGESVSAAADPFERVETLLREHRAERSSETGPFSGGALAIIGYGAAPLFEERLSRLGSTHPESSPPPIEFFFFDRGVSFDHERGIAVAFAAEGGPDAPRAFFERIEAAAESRPAAEGGSDFASGVRVTSDFTRDAYLEAVGRVREWIAAGDVYQVNLAQRLRCEWARGAGPRPEAAYARLRAENPAPYSALVETAPDRHVLSASPELFLERRGDAVRTRPIKGTRPRFRDAARDARSRRDLLESEKDRAELTMIVDLERNDLGKVCEFGSVRVAEPGELETHPWVHHRVATVEGTLRRGTTFRDLLAATFPTGSITGAPKIRAMEIIAEVERSPRGIYTGAIGWVGWDGDCELAVAIRTLELSAGVATLHAGGGIVADSEPAIEYEETLHKARGILRGLGAEGGVRA